MVLCGFCVSGQAHQRRTAEFQRLPGPPWAQRAAAGVLRFAYTALDYSQTAIIGSVLYCYCNEVSAASLCCFAPSCVCSCSGLDKACLLYTVTGLVMNWTLQAVYCVVALCCSVQGPCFGSPCSSGGTVLLHCSVMCGWVLRCTRSAFLFKMLEWWHSTVVLLCASLLQVCVPVQDAGVVVPKWRAEAFGPSNIPSPSPPASAEARPRSLASS